MKIPKILTIAGSDSGGGAGIQGDIKTITALGGYGMSAITALTAQNTLGVFAIHEVPAEFIKQQITLCLDDIGSDAIKTGMLSNSEIIKIVAESVKNYPAPLIVDPVMVAKSGAALLEKNALAALKTVLLPIAFIVTPNVPEAEILSAVKIKTRADMKKAAHEICKLGAKNVLIKGGHLESEPEIVPNILLLENGEFYIFETVRINSRNTHGTGCTMASALATFIGQGMNLPDAVQKAQNYVGNAIKNAPNLGKGHGPLWHMSEYL